MPIYLRTFHLPWGHDWMYYRRTNFHINHPKFFCCFVPYITKVVLFTPPFPPAFLQHFFCGVQIIVPLQINPVVFYQVLSSYFNGISPTSTCIAETGISWTQIGKGNKFTEPRTPLVSHSIRCPYIEETHFVWWDLKLKSWPTFEGISCHFAVYRVLMFMNEQWMNPFHYNVYKLIQNTTIQRKRGNNDEHWQYVQKEKTMC